MWQVKWFRVGVLIVSALVAVGITFIIILIHERSFSQSPAPTLNSTPLPSFQGQLPEPKTLGVATKNESTVPILMYHHIQDLSNTSNPIEKGLSLGTAKFREEMKYLSDSGYKTATLTELFYNVPDKRVVLTFDDGYKDVVDNALPALKEFGFRGVVFIIVDRVGQPGYLGWGDLERLNQEGWEIGSHTLNHPELAREPEPIQRKQIFESKKILEDGLDIKIEYFCYPAGRYNEMTINLVKEAGYLGAVTVEAGTKNSKDKIFELKRIGIKDQATFSSFKNYFK